MLRKLAEKTQSGYIRWVREFTRYLGVRRTPPRPRTCAAISEIRDAGQETIRRRTRHGGCCEFRDENNMLRVTVPTHPEAPPRHRVRRLAQPEAAVPRRDGPRKKRLGMREMPRRVLANPVSHRVRAYRRRGMRYSFPQLDHQPRQRHSTS